MAGGQVMLSSPNLKSQKKVLCERIRIRQKRIAERKELRNWYHTVSGILELYEALLKDFSKLLSTYSVTDQLRDSATLLKRFNAEGVSFATVTLPQLSKSLFTYLETGVSLYPGFKIKSGTEYPVFLQGLFKVIYNDVHSNEAITAIGLIYQFSVLTKKLKGPYPHRVLLKQAEDFVKDDQQLSAIDIKAEFLQPILTHARAIINNIFNDFDLKTDENVVPRPGPGATNTKVEKHMRYEPHMLYEKLDHVLPYKEWFYPPVNGYHVNKARNYRSLLKTRVYEPSARYHQVDKKIGEARGICIEENEAMWYQQAVKNGIYAWVEEHPITRNKVNFTKQSINQMLALHESKSRKRATIDMKSASDNVLRLLVKELFQDQTLLCDILMSLSTQIIEFPTLGLPPLRTNKFAPMGSALCFPIMALVHFALIQAIICNSNVKRRFSKAKDVYVYGDDIIISSDCVQAVYDWLPMFGMKINQDKSFVKSHFRESCGIHAYHGVDITPVFLKRTPNFSSGADTLLSVLASEEQLFLKGFYSTARLLRKRINGHWGILPFVSNESQIAGFRRPGVNDIRHIKFHAAKSRKCALSSLSCEEHRLRVFEKVRSIHRETSSPYMCENSRYLMKLVTGTKTAVTPDYSPDGSKLVWKWLLDSSLTTGSCEGLSM
jgi:hypothetical protein